MTSTINRADLASQSFRDKTWPQDSTPWGQEPTRNFIIIHRNAHQTARFNFAACEGNRIVGKLIGLGAWRRLLFRLGTLTPEGIELTIGWNEPEKAVRVTIVSPVDNLPEIWAQIDPQIKETLARHIMDIHPPKRVRDTLAKISFPRVRKGVAMARSN